MLRCAAAVGWRPLRETGDQLVKHGLGTEQRHAATRNMIARNCTPDDINGLPRFNMPLELGVFIGAARYGGPRQKNKSLLILDTEQHRYQKFISDIAGQDIRAHASSATSVIKHVRNWLSCESKRRDVPGGDHVARRYSQFMLELPEMCRNARVDPAELIYSDYAWFVSDWVAGTSHV